VASSQSKIVKTVCGMCNRQSCGMEVIVENGKVVDLRGNKEFPVNRGALCVKGLAAKEHLYNPSRLKYPMKKEDNSWKQISWDEALSTIAKKLKETKQEYGAESFAVFHGCEQLGETSYFIRRFMNVYGSPNLVTVGSMCSLMRSLVDQITFGDNFRPIDVEGSRCIVVWGANPAASHAPYYLNVNTLKAAKDRGAKLIAIDPLLSGTASIADIHVKIRPGTDGALALGMINTIIEQELYDKKFVKEWTMGFAELQNLAKDYSPEKVQKITGVPAELVKNVARTYALTKPSCVILGNALEQHSNSVQALRAMAALRAITGNIDVPGGNLSLPSTKLNETSLPQLVPRYVKPLGWRDFPLFAFVSGPPLVSFIDALLTDDPYPIKGMIVSYGNPMLTWPDTAKVKKGLERLDFLAVMDFYMTPTAELADIVLPTATFLERTGLHVFDQFLGREKPTGYIALAEAAVDPVEQSWPDWKFWFELAKKMGYEKWFPWTNVEEAIDYQLKPTGYTVEKLRGKDGFFHGDKPKFQKHLAEGFKTSSGKVELYSIALRNLGYDPLPTYVEPEESSHTMPEKAKEYPLILVTGSRYVTYPHSGLRSVPSLRKMTPHPEAFIHPQTAQQLSIKNGDNVVVDTERGSAEFKATVTEHVVSGIVSIPHGWAEANANLLVSNKIRDPILGAPDMKSLLCRIRPKR
jgi:anaerobic selenocysteine-containing dehydrogenase